MKTAGSSRREFAAGLAGMGAAGSVLAQTAAAPVSQLGSLYEPVQAIADASPRELSFLKAPVRDLGAWQRAARARILDLLQYRPPAVPADVQVIATRQREGYTEEQITFRTTPWFRVPAHVLVPEGGKARKPAIVLLHDHGGFYMWGREKVIATDHEHPVLTKFKQEAYGGRSIGTELVRQGYVVIAIDMFFWGERRLVRADDPAAWRERPADLTEKQVNDFNRRSGESESLVARAVLTAGATWPGIMLYDDLRTVDYLASRADVDANRIGCVGLSVGGYRSFMLAALDPRIRVAVDVCWMTTFAAQVERHIIHTMGLSFVIPGMYRYFDLPELSAAIAPRSLLVMMGSRDGLFPVTAMKASFETIGECYRRAGAPGRQRTLLFDAPHQFNGEMQGEAWRWVAGAMG